MPPITVNKILYGVTKKLADNFPDSEIYVEEVPEELNPPAFFVKMLESEQVQDLGARYWRFHSFDIHFFAGGYRNVDLHDVTEQLYELMRWIEIDGRQYQGINLRHEVVDRVLHFFVEFNVWGRYVEPEAPAMEELEIKEYLKGIRIPAWLSYQKVNLQHRIKQKYCPDANANDLLNEILGPNIWIPAGRG